MIFTKEKIREIRVNAGLSQRSFADALDVHHKTVESWEYGVKSPGRRSQKDLQKFVDCVGGMK